MENTRMEVKNLLISEIGETGREFIDELYENTKEMKFNYPVVEKVIVRNLPPFVGRIRMMLDRPLCIFGQSGYGKTTLINSIGFSLCGAPFLGLRGTTLADYFSSRKPDEEVRIQYSFRAGKERIEGIRKIKGGSQKYEGTTSSGDRVNSINMLENIMLDFCGLKQFTGRQFSDLIARVMETLHYSSEERNWILTDSKGNLEELRPLIFNLTYFQDAFSYIKRQIESLYDAKNYTEKSRERNRIRLNQIQKVIARISMYDLHETKKELEDVKTRLSGIRRELKEKENENMTKIRKLENEIRGVSDCIQKEQERHEAIDEQIRTRNLQPLRREIRTTFQQDWKYCSLCKSNLESKWETRIENGRCPICDCPTDESKTTETFKRVINSVKEGLGLSTSEPTEDELNACELSIEKLEERKESLEKTLNGLKRDQGILDLRKKGKEMNAEKIRLEERSKLLKRYEKILEEEKEMTKTIEEEDSLIKENNDSIKKWEEINRIVYNVFQKESSTAFERLKKKFEFYMAVFEGGESAYTLNSRLESIRKSESERIPFETLHFGRKIAFDLALRFSIADIIHEFHNISPVVLLDMPSVSLDQGFQEGLLEIFEEVIKSGRWKLVVTTESPSWIESFENRINLTEKVSAKIKTQRQLRLEEFGAI